MALVACGGSQQRENELRPPVPITLTGAIHEDRIQLSPATAGAGTIVLVVSNQSTAPQTVTFETDELGGSQPGRTFSTTPINPRGTASLKVDVRQGNWKLGTKDNAVRPAAVLVGRKRDSAQNDLLQP